MAKQVSWRFKITEIMRKVYEGEESYQYECLDDILVEIERTIVAEREFLLKKIKDFHDSGRGDGNIKWNLINNFETELKRNQEGPLTPMDKFVFCRGIEYGLKALLGLIKGEEQKQQTEI